MTLAEIVFLGSNSLGRRNEIGLKFYLLQVVITTRCWYGFELGQIGGSLGLLLWEGSLVAGHMFFGIEAISHDLFINIDFDINQ